MFGDQSGSHKKGRTKKNLRDNQAAESPKAFLAAGESAWEEQTQFARPDLRSSHSAWRYFSFRCLEVHPPQGDKKASICISMGYSVDNRCQQEIAWNGRNSSIQPCHREALPVLTCPDNLIRWFQALLLRHVNLQVMYEATRIFLSAPQIYNYTIKPLTWTRNKFKFKPPLNFSSCPEPRCRVQPGYWLISGQVPSQQ